MAPLELQAFRANPAQIKDPQTAQLRSLLYLTFNFRGWVLPAVI